VDKVPDTFADQHERRVLAEMKRVQRDLRTIERKQRQLKEGPAARRITP
jgi:hypothetical protein